MQKIKIVIADNSKIICEGVGDFLSQEEDLKVEKICSNGDEALSEAEHNECDLILLELSIPGKNGFDVLQEMRKKKLKTPVLIFTNYWYQEFIKMAKKLGARGFIRKEDSPDILLNAIRTIYQGGTFFSYQ